MLIFKKILEYKKYKNLYNYKSLEVILSFFVSIIFFIIINISSVYDNFYNYEDFIISFLSNSIFSFIGLIGFLLSAISITLSFLDKRTISEFENLNITKDNIQNSDTEKSSIEYIIFDFIFMGLTISILITFFIFLNFTIKSKLPLTNRFVFSIISLILSYLFFYVIFGSVALLYQCFHLFDIVSKLEEIIEKKDIVRNNLKEIERYYFSTIYSKEEHFFCENHKKQNNFYIFGLVLFVNGLIDNDQSKKYYFEAIEEKYFVSEDYINSILNANLDTN